MTDKTEAMDNLIAQDADLIDVASKVAEADREVLIRISNSDDETASRIHRGLIYTWEVGEIARHRQYGYDRGYYDGCTHPIVRHDALREALEAAPLIGATESAESFKARQDAWLNGPYRAALGQSK
jgi:hypothetical protein